MVGAPAPAGLRVRWLERFSTLSQISLGTAEARRARSCGARRLAPAAAKALHVEKLAQGGDPGLRGDNSGQGMRRGRLTAFSPQPIGTGWNAGSNEASWRSGYAEDCKSLHPGSIPGEASNAQAPAHQRRELDVPVEMNRDVARQARWFLGGLVGT